MTDLCLILRVKDRNRSAAVSADRRAHCDRTSLTCGRCSVQCSTIQCGRSSVTGWVHVYVHVSVYARPWNDECMHICVRVHEYAWMYA